MLNSEGSKTFLTFRTDGNNIQELSRVVHKGQPLTNSEIDGNFQTLKREIEKRAFEYNPSFLGDVDFSDANAICLPVLKTYEDDKKTPIRPRNPKTGMMVYNPTNGEVEVYSKWKDDENSEDKNDTEKESRGVWNQIRGAAVGGKNNHVFFIGDNKVFVSYKIEKNKNAMAIGPLEIGSDDEDVILEISDGSRLVII